MRRILVSLLFYALFLYFLTASTAVAGVLPRFQKAAKKPKAKVSSPGVSVSARLRSDRRAINIYLANLNKARQITYTLYYQTEGKDEGVSGSIGGASSDSVAREILFGTCSSGVCKYHTRITNARLEILTELLTGKKTLRKFRIRV